MRNFSKLLYLRAPLLSFWVLSGQIRLKTHLAPTNTVLLLKPLRIIYSPSFLFPPRSCWIQSHLPALLTHAPNPGAGVVYSKAWGLFHLSKLRGQIKKAIAEWFQPMCFGCLEKINGMVIIKSILGLSCGLKRMGTISYKQHLMCSVEQMRVCC